MEDLDFEKRLTKLVCKRSKAGDSTREIARVCKVTEAKVLDYLARSTQLTTKDLEIILGLKDKGLTLEEISDEFCVDLDVLQAFLPDDELSLEKKHNILLMSRKGRRIESICKILELKQCTVDNYLKNCNSDDSFELARDRIKLEEGLSVEAKKPSARSEVDFIYSFFNNTNVLYRTNINIGDLFCLRVCSYKFKPLCSLTALPSCKLFITGGGHPHGSAETHMIDVTRDYSVSYKAAMTSPRRYHASLYHAGHVYLIGGNNNHYLSLCERYTVEANKWETLLPLPYASNGLSVIYFEPCNSIYALGGHCSIRLDKIQRYSLRTQSWDVLETKLPYASFNIACFSVNEEPKQFFFVMNRELYSFNPNKNTIQHHKTLIADIECANGLGVYRRGYLYCLSSIGPAKSLFIGSHLI
mmetsp:Transcript_7575/g.14164  ORF Transcript_7575/g.14164 Transcript_7575/m.14164 type:complete len:414 (-) Transcript_7575:2577-3818(-)